MLATVQPKCARTNKPARRNGMLKAILNQVGIAWYFAWGDTKARYRRSVLGPLWLVFSTFIGVGGLGLVWSSLMKIDKATFIPPLAIGLVMWSMISGCVTGGSTVFIRRASIIKNIKTPSVRLSLELLFQQIINLAHNLITIVVILLLFPQPLSTATLLVIPAFILVSINLWWVIQLLGFLGARFRDLDPLVQAVMPILFFVSPVLYRSHELGEVAFLMAFNPLAYWLDIIRAPLQGSAPSAMTWAVTALMAVVGWGLAGWLTRSKGYRLPYWV